jgi:hypothetical protein
VFFDTLRDGLVIIVRRLRFAARLQASRGGPFWLCPSDYWLSGVLRSHRGARLIERLPVRTRIDLIKNFDALSYRPKFVGLFDFPLPKSYAPATLKSTSRSVGDGGWRPKVIREPRKKDFVVRISGQGPTNIIDGRFSWPLLVLFYLLPEIWMGSGYATYTSNIVGIC